MRLEGASVLAGLAGVPIGVDALQDWICGRGIPPRHSEGLDDPLSVAALFHFALSAGESDLDPIGRATLNMSRSLLDDRAEAHLWAPEDMVRFGPVWRDAQIRMTAAYSPPTLLAVAERVLETREVLERPVTAGQVVTTADGRQLRFTGHSADIGWLVACHMPSALIAAGLASHSLPNLVELPRLLPGEAHSLAAVLEEMIGRRALAGLELLDRLEEQMRRLPDRLDVTRRSKAPLLLRLQLAYPGLSRVAVARLLGISHQGATKLLARIEAGR